MSRALQTLSRILPTLAVAIVAFFLVGVLAGYRPVVILTGSMGDTIPTGSLVIAQPRPAEDIRQGDVIVMRREGKATVTHRVVEIEDNGRLRFAVTKGDANENIDAVPYPLVYGKTELVSRWVRPGWGRVLLKLFKPGPALVILVLVTLVITSQMLNWIWNGGRPGRYRPANVGPDGLGGEELAGPRRFYFGRVASRLAISPLIPFLTVGVAWALFGSSAAVLGGQFSVAGCADPYLASVQQGTTAHSSNGTVTVAINDVNIDRSFVLASVSSDAASPGDSTVQISLNNTGNSIDLFRNTNTATPPAVDVSWSVVEYACGVLVQRGIANGDGTSTLSVPITSVDVKSSFPIVSTASPAADTTFDGNDMYRTSLGPGELTIESGGPNLATTRSFAWQVVSYGNPADAVVQTVDVALGDGTTKTTANLSTPVDTASTIVFTEATSSYAGTQLDSRLVRAEVIDGSTIEVTRTNATPGRSVNVRVRTITLNEGTSVRHGIVDFAPGQGQKDVSVTAFDISRTTALSTSVAAGLSAGGRTNYTIDDTVGEATATFIPTDSTTVRITRGSTSSSSSFAWQVIEWAGPTWWDNAYLYRQRIEVATSTSPTPQGYTVPVVLDHSALVSAGVSRIDGRDVRLLHWDGTTWTELNRVLEAGSDWDQPESTILFKTVAAIGSNDTADYWLYYGNPSPAAPLEDPNQVYIVNEDFESGDTGVFEDRTAGSSWYEADPWTHRIPLTIAAGAVATDLTDFPVLVSLTDATLAAQSQADGSDIRFVANDGVTPLDHEIERWDSATGTLVAWVRLPTLPAAGASFYLLTGAGNAPDQQNIRTVWDASAVAVWHLARDPIGDAPQLDDSSITNIDGLSDGAMLASNLVTARIGQGVSFDGSDDRLVGRNLGVGNRAALSISAWVKADSVGTSGAILSQAGEATHIELGVNPGGAARATLEVAGAGVATVSGGSVPVGAWTHIALSWDGSLATLYVNGVWVGQMPLEGALTVTSDPVAIGSRPDGASAFDGIIDEVRVSATARTLDWIKAMYDNASSPATFVAAGPVQTGTWFAMGSWQYRKPVVVDGAQINGTASDIALPLIITDIDLRNEARPSGADIVITAADGVTRLDHTIESWDAVNGSLRAWVRVPELTDGTDLTLYIYYGNSSAEDQQDVVGTFGQDADMVQLGTP